MQQLIEGAWYGLAHQHGTYVYFAGHDTQTDTWILHGRDGEPVYRVGEVGGLHGVAGHWMKTSDGYQMRPNWEPQPTGWTVEDLLPNLTPDPSDAELLQFLSEREPWLFDRFLDGIRSDNQEVQSLAREMATAEYMFHMARFANTLEP